MLRHRGDVFETTLRTHADAGQVHRYLNYAREHWVRAGENPLVRLILCAKRDAALARYALEGLPSKVRAAEYRSALPEEWEREPEPDGTLVPLRIVEQSQP